MPSLKALKKRIVSVKNTQKITKAMKLVSAAKLRRATERAHSSRPYEEELMGAVSAILRDTEWSSSLTENREPRKIALVVISTDRGLCGSLNANVFKMAMRRATELAGATVEIIAIGKKGGDFFRRRGFKIQSNFTDISRNVSHAKVKEISESIRELFTSKRFDRIEVFYSRFQSAMVQKPSSFTLLPFMAPATSSKKNFLLEPAGPALLSSLVPMLIDFQLYRSVLESAASEHGARMSAMDSATKNARDMIDRLTLERNRARQAAITKELMEIISGAEALVA